MLFYFALDIGWRFNNDKKKDLKKRKNLKVI